MRVLVSLIGGLCLLAGVGVAGAENGSIQVREPWVREGPPTARSLAGYMTLVNEGEQVRTLVGAGGEDFGGVMLHRTVMEQGMAKMVHQSAVDVAAGARVVFEPDSYHLMLMQPKRTLRDGDVTVIELRFKDGSTLTVEFPVRKAMMGADHQHMHH